MSRSRRIGWLLGFVLLVAGLAAVPSPARADYDLGVTWPDVSVFNPAVTPYEITVIDSGPGSLEARWSSASSRAMVRSLPHDGTAILDLSEGLLGRIEIWRCRTTCEWAGASSPVITALQTIAWDPHPLSHRFVAGTIAFVGDVWVPTTTIDYAWAIRGEGGLGAPLDSGIVVGPSAGLVEIPVSSSLPDGDFVLEVHPQGDFGAGLVEGPPQTYSFTHDTAAPTVQMSLGSRLLFPKRDGYRDLIKVGGSASEAARFVFEVNDGSGQWLSALGSTMRDNGVFSLWWAGAIPGQGRVPAGTHPVRVFAVDRAGNVSAPVGDTVVVDDAMRKLVTDTQRIRPAEAIYSKFVGACSRLATPSSHGWPGSLGLYSEARCRTSDPDKGAVIVQQAVWIPEAVDRDYRRLRIETFGGAARGAHDAYLVYGLVADDGRFSRLAQFDRGLGWHSARGITPTNYVHRQRGRPYVVWSLGLTAGSRYDIRDYRLTLTYVGLVEPDGTVIPTPLAPSRPSLERIGTPGASRPAGPQPGALSRTGGTQ